MHLHSHIFNNKWFLLVLAGEFGIQYVIVEFPLFQDIFRTTSLSWPMHITCWVFGLGAIGVHLAAKKIFENEDQFSRHFKINMSETPELQNNKILSIKGKFESKFKNQNLDNTCESINEPFLDHNEEDGRHDQDEEHKED